MPGEERDHIPSLLIQHKDCRVCELIPHKGRDIAHRDARSADKDKYRPAPASPDELSDLFGEGADPVSGKLLRRISPALPLFAAETPAQTPVQLCPCTGKTENDDDAKFCKNCGAAMEDDRPFCPQCGKPVDESPFNPLQTSSAPNLEAPMTLGQWLITLILTAIPIVGFILLIVWAVSSPITNKKNYARATLILMIIVYAILFLFYGSLFLLLARTY